MEKTTASQATAKTGAASDERKSTLIFWLRRYSRFVMIAEAVLIVTVGYWLFVSGGVSAVMRARAEAAVTAQQAQARLDAIGAEADALQEMVSRYERLSDDEMTAIKEFLPNEHHLEELFVQLEAAVSGNGLLLTAIELADDETAEPRRSRLDITERAPLPGQPAEDVISTVFTIKISGASYPALKNLLSALERNRRLIDVTAVDYNPISASAELTAATYHLAR